MKYNVILDEQNKPLTREQIEEVVQTVFPEWAVVPTVLHLIDNYNNVGEEACIDLDALKEGYSPYSIVDYYEAVYLCQAQAPVDFSDDEDEDEIVAILEEWLDGYIETNESSSGYEFLVFNP